MLDPVTGSLILGGANLLGNFLSGESAYRRDRRDAIADWHRNNEYNSPKAQMQRYKEAGLNPQLIYGQGTPGNASATPTQTSKSGAPSHRMDLQSIYGEAKRLEMNMQQTQQTVENLKTNQELMQTNIELQNQLKDQREKEFPFKLDKYDASIHSLNSQSTWRNNLLESTLRNLNTRTDLATRKDLREERMLGSQLNLNTSRQQLNVAQTALTIQNRLKAVEDTVAKQITNSSLRPMLQAKLNYLMYQTDLVMQNRKTSMSIEELNKINTQLREWENTYKPINESVGILSRILGAIKTPPSRINHYETNRNYYK